jgi:uncharacterized protein
MKILRIWTGLLLALFCLFGHAQEFATIPRLQARVTDQAGMLNDTQRTMLENVLQDYETRTGNQIAILLVKSTAPEAIEQYSIRVTDAWKLGRKGVDDGVLLLVAKDNPAALGRLRIENGRGVQGVLTDAQSKRILQDVIAPHFRQNDFYGGLSAGVSAITSLLDNEAFPEPERHGAAQGNGGFGWTPFLFFLILIAITLMRSLAGRAPRMGHTSDGWGNSAGVILGSVIGNELGRRSSGGGFGGGGFTGGGGFSGGGGGFDGGGASGNW